MARAAEAFPENVPGSLFVDRTCIDCATCRTLVPDVYTQGDGFSFVSRQPESGEQTERALMALVACPTGSIGTRERTDVRPSIARFPERVEDEVSFCGFTSKDSFGAWSYFVERPAGNLLVDSPRAAAPLMKTLEARGGVATLLLTHRDDVADHAQLRARFGCERVLHVRDVTADTRSVERQVVGSEPVRLADDLLMIPTPGHTSGHAVFLYRDRFLFTGDHLAWSPRRSRLIAFRDACWYSWKEQIRSMERLLDFSFEWVLPGHGERFHASSAQEMRRELERCVQWMRL